MKEVSFVIKNKKKLLSETWKKIPIDKTQINLDNKDFLKLKKTNPSNSQVRKFVRIQNGCDHSCTFCIIPKCRGASISEEIHNINKTIKFNLTNNTYKRNYFDRGGPNIMGIRHLKKLIFRKFDRKYFYL